MAFTRGFISSQAFVDHFARHSALEALVPGDAVDGLTFVPTHRDVAMACPFMSFEAREAILDLLDAALGDPKARVGGADDEAERHLAQAGVRIKRQSMGKLQHNKRIYVDSDAVKRVLCGSTKMSWRGLYGQSNNALLLNGERTVEVFRDALEQYWDDPKGFKKSASDG